MPLLLPSQSRGNESRECVHARWFRVEPRTHSEIARKDQDIELVRTALESPR